MFTSTQVSTHRGDDDLLTAGLGLSGLRQMAAPPFADPALPEAGELRRRALWSSWRGIADLRPGGFADAYGELGAVPGREYHALAQLAGRHYPHRLLVQVPDAFDPARPCVVVTASSGSRGIYGAIAVAGAWGLPRGCAVAYTDKGAGSDYFDLDAGLGTFPTGQPGASAAQATFTPRGASDVTGVAFAHAHSQDNPEADWGRHVRQAAEYALQVLGEAWPGAGPFTLDNTRIIAVGLSNGGGAVLRAAEDADDWLDAVVAGEPSVLPPGDAGRSLFDYTTQAALLMPCALAAAPDLPSSPLRAAAQAAGQVRCAALAQAGVLPAGDVATQSRAAWQMLREAGWQEAVLQAGALSVDFDLWRAVAATYASAYGRWPVGAHPCGYGFSAHDAAGAPRPATAQERAAWWSDASGIPPGAGVGLIDTLASGDDPALPGLQCLWALATGDDDNARRVRAGIAATRAGLPREGLPVVLVHGSADGLIPIDFTSRPYTTAAQAAGRPVRLWQVEAAQHFDGFLALPDYGARYVPLLPYLHAALDQVAAHLDGEAPLPADARITPAAARSQVPTYEALSIPR